MTSDLCQDIHLWSDLWNSQHFSVVGLQFGLSSAFQHQNQEFLVHCESRLSLQCDECYNIWSAIDLCDHKFIIKMVMKTLLRMCKGSTSGGTDSFILYIS
jgi:hypothetical protein